MSDFQTVAKVGDIPVGEGRAYEYEGKMVAVFNNDGEYLAIDDMCPHMGASLATGHYEDCVVVCPWHGWSFDTRDGTWCDNRRIKIDSFEVRIQDDEIQVAAREKAKEESASGDSGACGTGNEDNCQVQDPASSDSASGKSDSEVSGESSPDESSTNGQKNE